MGLCNNDLKRKRPFKTIIIPRGLINPNEHNVIEIPVDMDATNLIVKTPTDTNASFSVEPYRGDITNFPESRPPPVQPTIYPSEVNDLLFSGGAQTPVMAPRRGEGTDNNYNNRRTDAGCQTQSPETMQQVAAPKRFPQERHTISFQQPPEAHSPLCPICARASCRYLSGPGINRPYTSKICQFSSPPHSCSINTYQPSHYQTTLGSPNAHLANTYAYATPYNESCYTPTPMSVDKSELFSRSRDNREDDILNKLLDDKIERILKPVLLSLVKFSPEDEEQEINQKYLGPCGTEKFSYSSLQINWPHDVPVDNNSRTRDLEYEDFKCGLKRREENFDTSRANKSASARYSNNSNLSESNDYKPSCSTGPSGPRRSTSVSFDDKRRRSLESADSNKSFQNMLSSTRNVKDDEV